ncbi:hypothetical protein D3C75_1102150 [compost metagenome]
MDRQLTEYWAAGHRNPLTGRVDQVAYGFHGQAHGQVLAALEGHQQDIMLLDRTAVAGHLIATRHQGAALDQGVLRVKQVVAEIVFDHGSSKSAAYPSINPRPSFADCLPPSG